MLPAYIENYGHHRRTTLDSWTHAIIITQIKFLNHAYTQYYQSTDDKLFSSYFSIFEDVENDTSHLPVI